MPVTKKQTKPKPKSKSVVSVFKPRTKWQVGFLVTAAILLLSSVGYTGYHKLKADSLTAKAAGYTFIMMDGNTTAVACKNYVPAYGGVYSIKVLYTKLSGAYPSAYRVTSYRGLRVLNTGTYSALYWNKIVGTQTVNLSALNDDSFTVTLVRPVGDQIKSFVSKNFSHTNVVPC